MTEMSRMPRLRAIVDAYMDEHGAKQGWIAQKIGLDRRGLWAWWHRGLAQMPTADVLFALAAVTRTPYRDVLDAALHDFGYLPEATAGMGLTQPVGIDHDLRIETGEGQEITPAPLHD